MKCSCRGVLVIGRGEFGQALGYFKDAAAIRPDDLVVSPIFIESCFYKL